mgnify:CR=1 FL=1
MQQAQLSQLVEIAPDRLRSHIECFRQRLHLHFSSNARVIEYLFLTRIQIWRFNWTGHGNM